MFKSYIPQTIALIGFVSLVPWPAEANNIAEYYPPGRGVCYIITNERQSYNLTKVRPGVYGIPPVCDFSTYKAPVPTNPTNAPSSSPDSTTSNPANPIGQNQITPAPPPPPVAPAPPPPSGYQRFSGTAPVDPNNTNNPSSSPPPSAYQRYTGTAPTGQTGTNSTNPPN
ncbi:hypothetical protein [Synechocystis sp. LKSZ1]|uniref:hypothetical protein n=1 Tax=Synechocystis sp. LKSZ1 TaxID=3144951 RepID=UPI00336BB847